MGQLITIDEVKQAMPKKKNFITQEAVDIINSSLADPEFQGESLLQTASTYEAVLKGARASANKLPRVSQAWKCRRRSQSNLV